MTGKGSAGNAAAALFLTVSLFVLWGFGHQFYSTLLPRFAKVFDLDHYETAWAESVYSWAYFVGAIPAALYARRFGYKAAILIGLGSFCVGAFVLYPAAETRSFTYFMIAATIMASGWILLEVAANPLAAGLGSVTTAVRRLNMAQSFYPVGALLGLYCGRWIVLSNLAMPAARLAKSVVHPYIVLGVVVLVIAFLIDDARFPAVANEQTKRIRSAFDDIAELLFRRDFVFGMAAQFCSVLALAGTWSINVRVAAETLPQVSGVFIWSLAIFGLGRIVGTALMFRLNPTHLLGVFSLAGLLLSLTTVLLGGTIGAVAMIASSFFLSISWPTVLGLSIAGRSSSLMKLGTALICMAGAIGGFAYPMLNVSSWFGDLRFAMIVPAVCYGALIAFALSRRGEKSIAA